MYRPFFSLARLPFDNEIPPDDLFPAAGASEYEARLGYLLSLRGIGLFTGEVGSGKTSIARKAAAGLHRGLYRVFYVPLTTGNITDLYKTIAWEMGLPTERSLASLFRAIRQEINRLCAEAKIRPVLIIDEAHFLRHDVLENIRLLTNYDMDSANRLTLVLVGQAELRRRLAMAVHEPFAQRIVVRYHLTGLARDELAAYLAHRLERAGSPRQLFEPEAVEALFQATNGLPRRVNLIAHHALNAAAALSAAAVSADHVRLAVEETS
ncbi:MAG: ExeA family protein [Thermodesulfobacteriota bacterium]